MGRQTQCKRRKRADESERRSDKRMAGGSGYKTTDSLLDVDAKRANQEDTVDGRGLGVRHLVLALLSAKARQLA